MIWTREELFSVRDNYFLAGRNKALSAVAAPLKPLTIAAKLRIGPIGNNSQENLSDQKPIII